MKTLQLFRIASGNQGTFGVLLEGGLPFALTLEPPWKNNQPFESCIPPGVYRCAGVNSVSYGYTYEVKDVPGRSLILFHCGNVGKNTKGCVLVGEQFEPLNGVPAIRASRDGYKEFMFRLRGETEFVLQIMDKTDRGDE